MKMIKIIKTTIAYLISRNVVNEDEREIYEYGLESIFYDTILMLILLAIGGVMRTLTEAVVISITFFILQTYGGGYHAKSHAMCISATSSGMFIALLNVRILHMKWQLFILLAAFVLLFSIPLVLHPRKEYLQEKKEQLRRKSRRITLVAILGLILLCRLGVIGIACIASALVFAAVSRVIGKILEKKC